MRQRVKRRFFIMGMALATGASGTAFAKGGKGAGEAPPYLDDRLSTQAAAFPGGAATRPPAFHGAMNNLMGHGPDDHSRGWRLELLPPEARLDQDYRPRPAQRYGLALRMSF